MAVDFPEFYRSLWLPLLNLGNHFLHGFLALLELFEIAAISVENPSQSALFQGFLKVFRWVDISIVLFRFQVNSLVNWECLDQETLPHLLKNQGLTLLGNFHLLQLFTPSEESYLLHPHEKFLAYSSALFSPARLNGLCLFIQRCLLFHSLLLEGLSFLLHLLDHHFLLFRFLFGAIFTPVEKVWLQVPMVHLKDFILHLCI